MNKFHRLAAGAAAAALLALMLAAAPMPQDAAPPARPTGLEANAAPGEVSLSWDDPDNPSITHYRIYRRAPAEDPPGEFQLMEQDTGGPTNSYVDTSAAPDRVYTYRITAVNQHGESPRSAFARSKPAPKQDREVLGTTRRVEPMHAPPLQAGERPLAHRNIHLVMPAWEGSIFRIPEKVSRTSWLYPWFLLLKFVEEQVRTFTALATATVAWDPGTNRP